METKQQLREKIIELTKENGQRKLCPQMAGVYECADKELGAPYIKIPNNDPFDKWLRDAILCSDDNGTERGECRPYYASAFGRYVCDVYGEV